MESDPGHPGLSRCLCCERACCSACCCNTDGDGEPAADGDENGDSTGKHRNSSWLGSLSSLCVLVCAYILCSIAIEAAVFLEHLEFDWDVPYTFCN